MEHGGRHHSGNALLLRQPSLGLALRRSTKSVNDHHRIPGATSIKRRGQTIVFLYFGNIYIYIYTSSNISYPTCNPLCLWIMCVKRKHHAISVLQSNNIFEWKSFPSRIPMCLYHELRIAHQKKLPVSGNIISGAWCPQKHGTLRADSLQVLGSKDGAVVWEVAPHYTNE